MKKFLLLLFLFMLCTNMYSKDEYLSIRIMYPYKSDKSDVYEDSIIKVSFGITEDALYFRLYNKTEKRLYLEWENFRIDDSAIAFDTDRRLKMDEYKSDEVIFPQNYSTHDYLIPKKAIDDSSIIKWWRLDRIKKAGEQFNKIIVPVRIDGRNIDYVFWVGVFCVTNGVKSSVSIPNKEQIDSICEGMKYEDVISLIGYPEYYTQNEKVFCAHYFNGLNIEFHALYKVHATLLSLYFTPSTFHIGLKGRKRTVVTNIDKSNIHNLSPEQYYKELKK